MISKQMSKKPSPAEYVLLGISMAVFALVLVVGGQTFAKNVERETLLRASAQKASRGVSPVALVLLTNASRKDAGLSELVVSPLLSQAAQKKADDMATFSYFAHTSPTGVTPWSWLTAVKYPFLFAGENLAVRFGASSAVHNAWMASPLHRANIMDTRYKEIGIATQTGLYKGQSTTYVVQFFGTQTTQAPIKKYTKQPALVRIPEAIQKYYAHLKGYSMNTLYTHIFGILAFGLIVFGYLGYRRHRQAGERMKPIICACVVASLVLVGYVIYLLIMSGSANNVSSGVIL